MQNFWSFIWIVIWCFVFFAYLMVLFQILGDIFRDHQLAGIWKGVWILVLIFMPFLGALVYLIARGRGMSERQVAAVRQAQSETNAYIKQVAGSGGGASPAEHIAEAKTLLDKGTITSAEYEQLKAKALA
jgi:hypothetical protein